MLEAFLFLFIICGPHYPFVSAPGFSRKIWGNPKPSTPKCPSFSSIGWTEEQPCGTCLGLDCAQKTKTNSIFSADSKLGGLSSLVTSAVILGLILHSLRNGARRTVQQPQQNKTLLKTVFNQCISRFYWKRPWHKEAFIVGFGSL